MKLIRPIAYMADHSDNSLSYGTIIRRATVLHRTFIGTSLIGAIFTCFATHTTSVYKAFTLATVFVDVVNVSRIAIDRLSTGLIIFRLQYIASIYRFSYALPMIIDTTRFGTIANDTCVIKSPVRMFRSSSPNICTAALWLFCNSPGVVCVLLAHIPDVCRLVLLDIDRILCSGYRFDCIVRELIMKFGSYSSGRILY